MVVGTNLVFYLKKVLLPYVASKSVDFSSYDVGFLNLNSLMNKLYFLNYHSNKFKLDIAGIGELALT